MDVPFTSTLAPGRGSSWSSVIRPLIVILGLLEAPDDALLP